MQASLARMRRQCICACSTVHRLSNRRSTHIKVQWPATMRAQGLLPATVKPSKSMFDPLPEADFFAPLR